MHASTKRTPLNVEVMSSFLEIPNPQKITMWAFVDLMHLSDDASSDVGNFDRKKLRSIVSANISSAKEYYKRADKTATRTSLLVSPFI